MWESSYRTRKFRNPLATCVCGTDATLRVLWLRQSHGAVVPVAQNVGALVVGVTHGVVVNQAAKTEWEWAEGETAVHACLGAECGQWEEEVGVDAFNNY